MTVTQQSPWLAAAAGATPAPVVAETTSPTVPDPAAPAEVEPRGRHAARGAEPLVEARPHEHDWPVASRRADPLSDPFGEPYRSQTHRPKPAEPAVATLLVTPSVSGSVASPTTPLGAPESGPSTPALSTRPSPKRAAAPIGSTAGCAAPAADRSVPVLASWPIDAAVPGAIADLLQPSPRAVDQPAARHAAGPDRSVSEPTPATAPPSKPARTVAEIMSEIEAQIEVEIAGSRQAPAEATSPVSVAVPIVPSVEPGSELVVAAASRSDYQPRRRAIVEPVVATRPTDDDAPVDTMWPDLGPVRHASALGDHRTPALDAPVEPTLNPGSDSGFDSGFEQALDRAFPTDVIDAPLAGAPCALYDDLSLPVAPRAHPRPHARPRTRAAGRRIGRRTPARPDHAGPGSARPAHPGSDHVGLEHSEHEPAGLVAAGPGAVAPTDQTVDRRGISPVLFGLLGLLLGLTVSGAVLGAAWLYLFPSA